MTKLQRLLEELNAIMRDNNDLNKPDTRQYILGLIEQINNFVNELLED